MTKFWSRFVEHFVMLAQLVLACLLVLGIVALGRLLIILSFVTWWGVWALLLFVIVVLSAIGALE